MTHQILVGPGARVALEVMRDAGDAIIARIADDSCIELVNHPLAWMEKGPQFKDGRRELYFDEEYRPLLRRGEPYPVADAARKLIKGTYAAPLGFRGGALEALIDVLPAGDAHLFAREGEFLGRFIDHADAAMIAKAFGARRPIIFGSPEEFMGLVHVDQQTVMSIMDGEREWPREITPEFAAEVFVLAQQHIKKKAVRIANSEKRAANAQRREEGPVHQARLIFEQMRSELESSKIIAACVAKGINKATAGTQLGRWRKENGITVKRISKKNATPQAASAKHAAPKPTEPAGVASRKSKAKSKAKTKGKK